MNVSGSFGIVDSTRFARRAMGCLACAIGLLLIAGSDTPDDDVPRASEQRATEPSTRGGRLIRVPLPITGSVDLRIKRAVDRALTELASDSTRSVLVFEFWTPPNQDSASSQFERSLSLARFLASDRLNRVRTVAYLPATVRGHAVLPVLACEEIVMAETAELGEAGIHENVIDPTVRRGYSEIAERRRTIPTAIALGMLDPELKILKVTSATGARYVMEEEVESIRQQTAIQSVDTIIQSGELGRFTGNQLRLEHGFASHLANNRTELAECLKLAARQLEFDPSIDGHWRPIRLEIVGPINSRLVNHVQRSITSEIKSNSTNLICLWLDTPGGDLVESMRLASFLGSLDSSQVRTIAYIAREARSDAAAVALACDQIVMQENATIGGPGAEQPSDNELDAARETIRSLAQSKSRRWSLTMAMMDERIVVSKFTRRGTDVVEYFSEEELAEQPAPDDWGRAEEITTAGEPLRLDAAAAESFQLARNTVTDFNELKSLYQLEIDPQLIAPNWASELIESLASPHVAGTLLFFAGFGLVAELASPGIGVGGFMSVLCFSLYFWSQYLRGTAESLEIILFLVGVGCIVVEVFLIPGLGVFGLGGGALVVAALILASQTFIFPRNEYQLQQLPRSLFMVAAPSAGVIAAMIVLRRYMHRTPLLRHVMLPPVDDGDLNRRESLVDRSHLLGKEGITSTPLNPSGKARFGDELVDVIADGEAVDRGTKITAVDVSGNRILVTRAKRAD